jgi:hypothetical protein
VLKFLLALHLVLAVFVVGPLAWAATTAGRGVRTGDGAATATAARLLTIYAYASALVVIAGMALMSQKVEPADGTTATAPASSPPPKVALAEFSDTWIWLSVVLWAAAVAITLGIIVPTLRRVTKLIKAQDSVVTLTGRVAAAGGIVGLIFIVIVVLMAYKPGS